ncbi:hypothetical protein EDD17DRAFT_1752517 [Pisolithus thermaeus]|nr:hypothetical protein EDD17DRAFT_1752517 [Pisolithus thermaeus]
MTLLHDILVEEALVTLAGMSEEFHNMPLTIMIKMAQDSQSPCEHQPQSDSANDAIQALHHESNIPPMGYQYPKAHRHVGQPFDGKLRMVDIDMVDVSQMSDDDAHDTCEKLSLLAKYHALFLSQKSCLPPTSNVVFTQPPELSLPDTPGPLDMKKSTLFLAHQSAIRKTMELIDSVSSQSHDSMRTARCNLIREIQDYQGFLECIVTQEWLRQKAKNVKFKSYLRSILPKLVDNPHANNVNPLAGRDIDLDPLQKDGKQSVTKAMYSEALLEWFIAHNGPEIRCPQTFPHPTADLSLAWTDVSKPVILNRNVLREIWADMSKTTLPTWISRAPHNFGSASLRKLKADQWRTACMINLVITLCRLWGKPGTSQWNTDILKNFLSLIIAVHFATMQSTTVKCITIVDEYFKFSLKSLVSIFGKGCLVVNNHLSLHIAECLRGFGPAHGWWAFPFERYNGIMQCYKTNQKLGEVKLMFVQMFCRGGNLKVLMASDYLPEVLGSFWPIIQEYFGKDFRGSVLADLLALTT